MSAGRRLALAAACLCWLTAAAPACAQGLPLPAPGTYKLDRIFRAPFGVTSEGGMWPHLLSRDTEGAITLLSFFYTQCVDPLGCPLAWEAFGAVRAALQKRPALAARTRLAFYSFDPAHDGPALQLFAASYSAGAPPVWRFITGWNDFFMRRTLSHFGQEISPARNGDDGRVVIDHMLKVFLIDRAGWVREIYTTGFLDPKAILGDIETLALEEERARP
ncbi:MAG: SCO family protein [Hyphomicrobiales bacterium]|nr:SCO family protein [Hyphomicrobiales bacterium]